MGVVMRDYFFKDDVDGSKDGHLPKMTVASKGILGLLMVSSFCERITSCANLVCPKNNRLLSDDEIDMSVTLRMNRDFMQHMRLYYPEVIQEYSPHIRYPRLGARPPGSEHHKQCG